MAGLCAEGTTSGCSVAVATDEGREFPIAGLVGRSPFAFRCSLVVALDAVAVRHVQWGGAAVRDPEESRLFADLILTDFQCFPLVTVRENALRIRMRTGDNMR